MDTKVKLAWTPSVSKVDSYQLFIRNSENLQITNQYTVSSDVYEFLVEMLTPSTPYTVFVSALLNNERSSYLSDGFRTNIGRLLTIYLFCIYYFYIKNFNEIIL